MVEEITIEQLKEEESKFIRVSLDKRNIMFDCPSECGLGFEVCRKECFKCWENSLIDTLGYGDEKGFDGLIGKLMNKSIDMLTLERDSNYAKISFFINGKSYKTRYAIDKDKVEIASRMEQFITNTIEKIKY